MNISNDISNFWVKILLKFFDADPGSWDLFDPDPVSGMEKFGSGVRNKHLGSVTLQWQHEKNF
jgi:hypothetical protein